MPRKAPVLGFYTHKGGVSKTTNVQHLAWVLANTFGKRVLLVDCDPQCNLTQTLVPESRQSSAFLENTSVTTVHDVLAPLFEGRSKALPEPVSLQVRPNAFSNGALFLLPGSLQISTFEPVLALAHSLAVSRAYPLFDSLPGAFRSLFERAASRVRADLVIVDMGPSIGELNRNLFYSLDSFVMPCTADVYSSATVKTMQETLAGWAASFPAVREAARAHAMPVAERLPQFLGCVVSMFNVAGKEGKPVRQSQTWIDTILSSVELQLAPKLAALGMADEELDVCLAQVPHFLSLLPLAQRASYPVFAIPETKFEVFDDKKHEYKKMSPAEVATAKKRADAFREIYKDFAKRVLVALS